MNFIRPYNVNCSNGTQGYKKQSQVPYMMQRKIIAKNGDKKSMDVLKWAGIIAAGVLAVGGTIYAVKKGKAPNADKIKADAERIVSNTSQAGDKITSVPELSVADKLTQSQLEEKIADGQILSLEDALKQGFSEQQIDKLGFAKKLHPEETIKASDEWAKSVGDMSTRALIKAQLEEKIADGQISSLSDAIGQGFGEAQINSLGFGDVLK